MININIQKLKEVVSEILEILPEEVNDSLSQENTEKWDSMRHLNLIMAIEEEFDIQFAADEVIKIKSFYDIRSTLLVYGKNGWT